MTDVEYLGGAAFDHGRAEHARSVARHFDVEPVLDDVDDFVDHNAHGTAGVREHQDRLRAVAFEPGLAVNAHQRHQLAAILHKPPAIRDFDLAAIDLLQPRDQRKRHRFRLLRTGAEQEQRHRLLGRRILLVVRVHAYRRLGPDRGPERMRDAVRIDDHDHRAVAQDGIAGEHRDLPQLRRHRLDHDLFGVEHAVDDDAEGIAADLRHHDVAFVAGGLADPKNFLEMHERQQPVAQTQNRRVLDALDAMLAVAARAHQLDHRKLGDREAFAPGLDDQRGDDRERERNLDDDGRADARRTISSRSCRRAGRYWHERRPCRRRGRTRSSPAPPSRIRAQR